jgi:hypothetical protein
MGSAVLAVLGMSAFEVKASSLNQLQATEGFSGTKEDLRLIQAEGSGSGTNGSGTSGDSCSSNPDLPGC